MASPRVLYVMGVSGSGKTTIGGLLAKKLGLPFFDGDNYHPKVNVKKMAAGNPLTDQDRIGWLRTLNSLGVENREKGAVIVCSALKETYRAVLRENLEEISDFVYLKGSFSEILARLKERKGHFMPMDLLKSQFATLETPKNVIAVSIKGTPEEIVERIRKKVSK